MSVLVSRDPANGEPIGEVEVASNAEVTATVEAARDARPAWHDRDLKARLKVLQRFRRLLLDRRDEAAGLVTRESGKPLPESRMADVLTSLETARHLVHGAADVLAPQKVRIGNPILFGRRSRITREPLGVVGVIAPWNYPLAIPTTGVLTALAAGNAVVLKPSEETPLIGQWMVDLLYEAGVPKDVVGIVHGQGDVGAAMLESSIDGVLFTGSVATGKKVADACNKHLLPAVLELGGKDPMIVLPGADFDRVVEGATWGAFTNAGQTCAAVERLYLPKTLEKAYLDAIVADAKGLRLGHGLEPGVQMGPLINDAAVERMHAQVKDAEKKGATVLCGGSVRDDLGPRFFEPTVLSGCDGSMDVMRDETFGPLLPVQAYTDPEEAITWANDSIYGLTASTWGPDQEAREVAQRLEAGTVSCNECLYTYAAPETPWGGWKQSGLGASHGTLGLEAVTRWRHMHTAPAGRGRSPWHYPYDEGLDEFLEGGLQFLHGGARGLKGSGKALRGMWKRR